jgi:hypothetical protein
MGETFMLSESAIALAVWTLMAMGDRPIKTVKVKIKTNSRFTMHHLPCLLFSFL